MAGAVTAEAEESRFDPQAKIRTIGAKPVESQFEHIHFPLGEFNHGAQLIAIRGLLYRQERADQELSDRIKEAEEGAGEPGAAPTTMPLMFGWNWRRCLVIKTQPIAWRLWA